MYRLLFIILFFQLDICYSQTYQLNREINTTFFVGSDLHFGKNDSISIINKSISEDMTSLPGKYFSDSLLGKVPIPDWVSFTGDLTDNGEIDQWANFTSTFGLNGEDSFPFPVHEGFGNHDGPNKGISPSPVREGIKLRNMSRKAITEVSSDSLHYSWDSGGVHFVNLNSYPGDTWDSNCDWCHYFKEGFREPGNSLKFLEFDLNKNIGLSGRPIVLFFHYGFDEWGNKWWTKAEQTAFYEVIKDYNILAIFHGHTHAINSYEWRGIPIWNVGATQQSPNIGEYLVVQIQNNKIIVHVRANKSWGEVYRFNFK